MPNTPRSAGLIKKRTNFLTLLLDLAFISEILRTKTNKKYKHVIPQNTYMFLHTALQNTGRWIDVILSSKSCGNVTDGKI